jgi:hypothetical protein
MFAGESKPIQFIPTPSVDITGTTVTARVRNTNNSISVYPMVVSLDGLSASFTCAVANFATTGIYYIEFLVSYVDGRLLKTAISEIDVQPVL